MLFIYVSKMSRNLILLFNFGPHLAVLSTYFFFFGFVLMESIMMFLGDHIGHWVSNLSGPHVRQIAELHCDAGESPGQYCDCTQWYGVVMRIKLRPHAYKNLLLSDIPEPWNNFFGSFLGHIWCTQRSPQQCSLSRVHGIECWELNSGWPMWRQAPYLL